MTPALAPSIHTLGYLLNGIVTLPAGFECELHGVELDSRCVQPGVLFMACKGQNSDGRQFVDDAIARGAGAVLAEAGEGWQGVSLRQAVPVVAVENLPARMAELAARYYANPGQQTRLVGVTGTNGKTSCCQLIAQLLTAFGTPCGVIGTLGYGMSGKPLKHDQCVSGTIPGTTPDAISLQRQLAALCSDGAEAVVMEVSSHGLQQHRVIVDDYSVALFTNLTRDHLDYHGTMEAYGACKRQMFGGRGLQLAILNADDPFVVATRDLLAASVTTLTWGIGNSQADINAREVRYHAGGQTVSLTTPWGDFTVNSTLLGTFNTSNLLGVLALVLGLESVRPNFNPGSICQYASGLDPVSGRMQLIDYPEAPLAVVVDYAHTPDALEKALQAMRQHCEGRLWCVFGCGGDRDRGKRPLMAAVAERLADVLVLTSDNPRFENPEQILAEMQAGLVNPENAAVQSDRATAIRHAISSAIPGDCILIAGKGHESWQEIAGNKFPFNDIDKAVEALGQCYRHRGSDD